MPGVGHGGGGTTEVASEPEEREAGSLRPSYRKRGERSGEEAAGMTTL